VIDSFIDTGGQRLFIGLKSATVNQHAQTFNKETQVSRKGDSCSLLEDEKEFHKNVSNVK